MGRRFPSGPSLFDREFAPSVWRRTFGDGSRQYLPFAA